MRDSGSTSSARFVRHCGPYVASVWRFSVWPSKVEPMMFAIRPPSRLWICCLLKDVALRRGRRITTIRTHDSLVYADSAYAAAEGADALLILTDWQEFGTLDLVRMRRSLRYPIVIDGRNLYDPEVMRRAGFTYLSVGRPAVDGTLIPNAPSYSRKDAQPMTTMIDTRGFSNASQ